MIGSEDGERELPRMIGVDLPPVGVQAHIEGAAGSRAQGIDELTSLVLQCPRVQALEDVVYLEAVLGERGGEPEGE